VHGDVSLLLRSNTDGSTSIKATYGYLPYGQPDNSLNTGEPNPGDPLNRYRFNDRPLDTASGSEAMGARRFGTGIGRFLQQDYFVGSSDDLGLTVDTPSQNRYAYGASDPVNLFETDGHMVCGSACGPSGRAPRGWHAPHQTWNKIQPPETPLGLGTAPPPQPRWAPGHGVPQLSPDQEREYDLQFAVDQGLQGAGITPDHVEGGVLAAGINKAADVLIPNVRAAAHGEKYSATGAALEAVFFVPGLGEVGAGGRIASRAEGLSRFSSLTHASEGIRSFSAQARVTAGHAGDIQAHHLIEKRFADVMGGDPSEWASIVATRSEHQAFTNAWRARIPYGAGTRAATRAQVESAARDIYADYPDILGALGLLPWTNS
jgi:RHS repeat-associated protein